MKRKINLFMSLLALATCLVTFVATLVVSYQTALTRMETETFRQASLVAAGLEEIRDLPEEKRQEYLEAIGKSDRSRVTLIRAGGTVEFDSNYDSSQMENHLERPEVQEALESGEGASVRTSATLGQQTYYAAIELSTGEILRLSNTTDIVTSDLQRAIPPLILIILVACVLSIWLAHYLTRRLVSPINNLQLDEPESNNIYEELSPLLSKISNQNIQIEQQIDLLRQRQMEFDAITSNMAEGLIVCDEQLHILSVNHAAVRLLGAGDRDWTGESLVVFSRDPQLNQKAKAAVTGEKISYGLENAEGSHLQIYFSPVDGEGKARGCVMLIVDISERYAAERSRREFTGNVSHELKTPLTSISGYAEMISTGLARPDDVRGFGEKIHKEAGRLLSLVDDIMKLSRLDESTPAELPFESVELYGLVQETVKRLQQTAESNQVTLELTGSPITVRGVRQMLDEATFNLCENAIKYNRPGGHVQIAVSSSAEGAQVRVADDGIGIDPEDQAHIFERFYRADKSHSQKISGTGLGLAIVKHVCEIHGGTVDVESTPGKGSAFTLHFPLPTV
ncbi:sensor histidine kinase [Intestinibacillus sp. Marseille-P6563]|uniref:sensor histidine kinase n=1 Tax=Intestinibacillus sp. Marseille-P6563 TaxID=2364792 RepID=UPI000F05A080|nr:ATP-binding protein [Intestinibacillus sp. Marseille-P6563]